MAQLVAVCRGDNYKFQRRQMPLVVDDTLTMVMEFADSCAGCCDRLSVNSTELDKFVKNFKALSADEVSSAVCVGRAEILNQLSQLVHCVGCRHSVEKLFDELVETSCPALDPLTISKSMHVTVTERCRQNPAELYNVIYRRRPYSALDLAAKVKKGKRCPLHSLDLHKSKALWTWQEVWDVSTKECQEEITQIDSDSLLVTVEEYLRKHRFCTECKAKVLRAYSILIDEADALGSGKSDRLGTTSGHCRALFREVRACTAKRHIHVPCDEKYLKDLIERAEPELSGNQMERHAKSMEIAQEEVLTCLGVHLHDRFFRIQQKLKVEDKSWQLLFAIGSESIRCNLEASFVRRQGSLSVELICQELMLEDASVSAKASSSKRPRQKKKKVKAVTVNACIESPQQPVKEDIEPCMCTSGVNLRKPSSDANHNTVTQGLCKGLTAVCSVVDSHVCTALDSGIETSMSTSASSGHCCESVPSASHSDLGYASDIDCESCSMQMRGGHLEGTSGSSSGASVNSEFSHSSGCCSPSSAITTEDLVDSCRCDQLGIKCRESCYSACMASPTAVGSVSGCCHGSSYRTAPSLEDMLMASEEDDPSVEISAAEIQKYRDNEQVYARERLALRQTLRQKFASMQKQKRNLPWHNASSTETAAGLSSSNDSLISS